MRNIQVFLRFANFYQRFIQGFSKIVALLTSILKITSSPNAETSPTVANNSTFPIPQTKLAFLQLS